MAKKRSGYWAHLDRKRAEAKEYAQVRAELRAEKKALRAEREKSKPVTFGPDLNSNITLSPGDPLPAQWSFYPDGRIWLKEPTWFKSKIGKTIVLLGKDQRGIGGYAPKRVENCLFPNGKRGLAIAGEPVGDTNEPVWRRPTSDRGHWWPGRVHFSQEDAVFNDFEERLPVEKIGEEESKSWLLSALMGQDMPDNRVFWTHFYNICSESETLKDKLHIDTYAWAFYALFLDYDFIEKASGAEVYYTSDRRIGEIIARLRGCGESYLDFYLGSEDLSGPSPTDKEKNELLDIFAKLGFVPTE